MPWTISPAPIAPEQQVHQPDMLKNVFGNKSEGYFYPQEFVWQGKQGKLVWRYVYTRFSAYDFYVLNAKAKLLISFI